MRSHVRLCNKKVLLRERKRHTARRVAIAISCYSRGGGPLTKKKISQSEHVSNQIWCQKLFPLLGGGGPSTKIFFPVSTCIKPNLVSKFFPFTGGGGGGPSTKFFFQSEHVSSQIWCQKIFPLLGGGSLDKNFFSSLNMYQAKSGVKKFFPLLGGGGPSTKIFFPVWTCIKPNLVSKIFPFTGGGGCPLTKIFFLVWTFIEPNLVSKFFPFTGGGVPRQKFFSGLNMYQAKSGVKIFPFTGGVPWQKFFPSLNMYRAKSGVKNFSLYFDWVPLPLEIWDLGSPSPEDLRPGTPCRKSETWNPPPTKNLRPGTPPPLNRHTPVKI